MDLYWLDNKNKILRGVIMLVNDNKDNAEKENEKETCASQVAYEDSEGNYRYLGFWSGFGDQ